MRLFGRELFTPRVREVKQSQSQAVAMLMYVGQQVAWMKRDIQAYSTEGYMACVDAYACIDLIAKAISTIPLVMERVAPNPGDNPERIPSHSALDLMERPNPGQGFSSFVDASIRYLLIAGNSYIEAAGPTVGPPRELYTMKPNRVGVLVGSRLEPIKGYRYTAGGNHQDFTPAQVLHFKTFNPDPNEDWYGLAPIQIAARAIDTSNMAMEANGRLVKNDFRPQGAIKIERDMTPDQEKDFNAYIKAAYGGENSGYPLVLSGGKDFIQMSMTPKDADFKELDTLTTLKICRTFNVAPELIGVPNSKTYSNYQEARLALYMETAIPLAQWWLDELNAWMMPKFEGSVEAPGAPRRRPTLRLVWDIDKVAALQEKRSEMYAKLEPAWWVGLDERRKICGLGPWKSGGDDLLMIPMGLTPYGDNTEEQPAPDQPQDGSQDPSNGSPATPALPPAQDTGDQPKSRIRQAAPRELKGFWTAPEHKRMLWDNFEARVKAKERPLMPEVERFLKAQGRAMAKRALGLTAVDIDQADDPVQAKAAAQQIVRVPSFIADYKKRLLTRYLWMFQHAGAAGIQVAHGKGYDPVEEQKQATGFHMTADIKRKVSDLIMNSAQYIGDQTVENVGSLVVQAQAEGWTVEDLAQHIGEYMDERMPTRARLIARTETAKVENAGTIEGYKQTEFVEQKGWVCAFVEDSREAHIKADQDYSNDPIPLDQPFLVDGEDLQYPGDPAGSPGNICNCLCTTFPEVGEPKGE